MAYFLVSVPFHCFHFNLSERLYNLFSSLQGSQVNRDKKRDACSCTNGPAKAVKFFTDIVVNNGKDNWCNKKIEIPVVFS